MVELSRRRGLPGSRSPFLRVLADHDIHGLRRAAVTTLQINVGKRCNQACKHCHVDAGPARTEMMPAAVCERVIELLAATPSVSCLDITGGAPELHARFRWLVERARALGRSVIDRCNLTVLFEPGQDDTADFLATHGVKVIASLPCYTADNVDRQRGRGVFARSIEAVRWLNRLGYARPGTGLELDLVYNPLGPSLPPAQPTLERRYRQELRAGHGIEFNRLLTLTNLPIHRFADDLRRAGRLGEYGRTLVEAFNPATVAGLMCRSQVSVSYDGTVYDCDFNQMLGLAADSRPTTVWNVDSLDALAGRAIATGSHCFGCTAGAGSSCGGALT